MTENEKYTVKKWYNESAIYEDGELFAIVDVRMQAKKIAHRLNEQDKRIKELEEENKQLKEELESFEQVSFTDMCDGSSTVLYMKKENVGDLE